MPTCFGDLMSERGEAMTCEANFVAPSGFGQLLVKRRILDVTSDHLEEIDHFMLASTTHLGDNI